jgi:hypothetical protein
MATITVPFATAYTLHLTGAKHGRTTTGLGMAYLASLSSFLVAGTFFLVSLVGVWESTLSTGGAAVLTAALIGTTLLASAGFGYLAFRRRDRLASRRVDARLIPGLSSRAVGVSWLVRY